MRRKLACAGLLAFVTATFVTTLPAAAARLYVPVLGGSAEGRPLATSVWATALAGSERNVGARFLGRDGAGPHRDFALADGAQPLDGIAAPGQEGLIALDAPADAVSAWVATDGDGEVAELPLIEDADAWAAGSNPGLALPEAGASLRVAAANLGSRPATCTATLEGADGAALATRRLAVAPHGLAHLDVAPGERAGAVAARVSCDQPFYPLAVSAGDDLRVAVAKASGANGSCDRWLTLQAQPDGSWLAQTPAGVFHQGTTAHPKGILCIKAPAALNIGRAVYDWDVVAGPWWPKKPTGIHNLGYFFGERYRSGVLGNINATGTKGGLRIMQNYSLPMHHNTSGGTSYHIQKGALYHATYTFDAAQASATLQLFRNGQQDKAFGIPTVPQGRALQVKPYGSGSEAGLALVAEFGNYISRGMPEVPTLGWTYGNFRLRLWPK
jgi:hypothetical protein